MERLLYSNACQRLCHKESFAQVQCFKIGMDMASLAYNESMRADMLPGALSMVLKLNSNSVSDLAPI